MTLVKFNPTRPVRFNHPMENLFNFDPFNKSIENGYYPLTNISESEDQFKIEIAVPGLRKEDVSINVEKNQLIIEAKKEAELEEGETIIKNEFGDFEMRRVYNLPKTVNREKIEASQENGVLTIVLTKKEEAKEKPSLKIEIS